jgi:glutathione S-transferase
MKRPLKIYVILGSHACRTALLMLDHKGLDYATVRLPTAMHPFLLRTHGFKGGMVERRAGDKRPFALSLADRLGTVPALRDGSKRVQTNRAIARFLDEISPDPRLVPTDPGHRTRVEEAEAWADETLQMTARRLGLAAVLHGPDALVDRARDGRLGPLLWKRDRVRFYGARFVGSSTFAATPGAERRLLADLPSVLDRADALVEAGTINGTDLNVADFLIAPSLALLGYRRDLADELPSRPSWALVERLLPAPAT